MFKAPGKGIKEHLRLCKSTASLFLNVGYESKVKHFPLSPCPRQLWLMSPHEKKQEVVSMEPVKIFWGNACPGVTRFASSFTLAVSGQKGEMREDAGSENVLYCYPSSLPLPLASLFSLGLSRGDTKACHQDYFPFSTLEQWVERWMSHVFLKGAYMHLVF